MTPQLIETGSRRVLISYHGTVVHFDAALGRLCHANAGMCEANVYAVRSGEGAVLLWQDGETARAIGRFDHNGCGLAEDGSFVQLSERPIGIKGLQGFAIGEYFLSAEPNGGVTFSRLIPGNWESFLLADPDDFDRLEFIVSNIWLRRMAGDTIEETDAAILPGPKLRIGRVSLPASKMMEVARANSSPGHPPRDLCLMLNGWKLDRYVVYRPLAYLCAYGRDEIFTLLELAVSSLFEFGRWLGDILVITDAARRDYVKQLLAAYGGRVHVAVIPAVDLLDYGLARYRVNELHISARYQPIIYLDTDIICDAPIDGYLKGVAFDFHLDVVEEFALGHADDYYGKTLLELDGTGFLQGDVGCSSGLFAFRNAQEQRELFNIVLATALNCGETFGRLRYKYFDQPFFNYVRYKLRPPTGSRLSALVHLHLNHLPFLQAPIRKGFVHFAGTFGNAVPKIAQMKSYLSILRQ